MANLAGHDTADQRRLKAAYLPVLPGKAWCSAICYME